MKKSVKSLLIWTPRILCILFALFISLFSLDVLNESRSFGETVLALVIHLIPVFVIIIVLVLSWRWAWVGGLLYVIFGAAYIITAWGKFVLSAYLFIAGPLFLIGVLFWINWYYRSELKVR